MPNGWTVAPQGLRTPGTWDGDATLSTGPLAIDPETQRYVGVLVQNNRRRMTEIGVRLFNLDVCPKDLCLQGLIAVDPDCAVGMAFANPGFFYEVQLVLPSQRAVRASIYALTADFVPLAASTLHWRDLTAL